LILASGSPRRAQLLAAAGYEFTVQPASDRAECGICSGESAAELVARYAFQKAADVASQVASQVASRVASQLASGLVLAADTVAFCAGNIIGKPRDRADAERILRSLSSRRHHVLTGICLRSCHTGRAIIDVISTELEMQPLSDAMLREYLASGLWEGKAGAFGYQDGNDWLRVVGGGSESNVVGLPMERLAELLEKFDQLAETVTSGTIDPPMES
jgi:septum formation protein